MTIIDEPTATERARETRERAEVELAVAALHPERFGMRRHRDGWRKRFPGLGEVVFAPLRWQHAQCPSYDVVAGAKEPLDALSLVVRLQGRVWGMPPEELVPVNMLAVLPDTGGSVIVAYREDAGFNADGWLGFVIAAGSRSGTLVSHMLGVREEQRGTRDLGWHLKLLQGYDALRTGHRSATWTYDPMRGANARLNLEKLGTTVRNLTLDKYGVLRSELYGDVPSDRFAVYWDLLAPATHHRLDEVHTERYAGPDPEAVRALPEITPDEARQLADSAPAAVRYRIPGDIDDLMTADTARANAWRTEMRAALSPFMTIKSARVPQTGADSPILVGVDLRPGAYDVVAFASDARTPQDRENWYVLRRRGGES
jgi:predicted GNAT superfamily acetyltransferase